MTTMGKYQDNSFKQVFDRKGYETILAKNGEEVLKMHLKSSPDGKENWGLTDGCRYQSVGG